MSKIRIIREERDELDFVIAQKLRRIQELGEKIKDLEGKLEQLRAERKQAEASKTCPEQPSMAELIRWCSAIRKAMK